MGKLLNSLNKQLKSEHKQDAIEYSLNAFKVPKEYFGKEEIKIQCKDCNNSLEDCTCIEDTIDMKQETLEETSYTRADIIHAYTLGHNHGRSGITHSNGLTLFKKNHIKDETRNT